VVALDRGSARGGGEEGVRRGGVRLAHHPGKRGIENKHTNRGRSMTYFSVNARTHACTRFVVTDLPPYHRMRVCRSPYHRFIL